MKNDVFYILLENKYLYRQMIKEFSTLYKGIHKLDFFEKQDNEEKKTEKYL